MGESADEKVVSVSRGNLNFTQGARVSYSPKSADLPIYKTYAAIIAHINNDDNTAQLMVIRELGPVMVDKVPYDESGSEGTWR